MINITEIVLGVIALVTAVLSAYAVPLLRSRAEKEKIEKVLKVVEIFVTAADQIFAPTLGAEKKLWVMSKLEEYGVNVELDAVDAMVEASVLRLHRELTE